MDLTFDTSDWESSEPFLLAVWIRCFISMIVDFFRIAGLPVKLVRLFGIYDFLPSWPGRGFFYACWGLKSYLCLNSGVYDWGLLKLLWLSSFTECSSGSKYLFSYFLGLTLSQYLSINFVISSLLLTFLSLSGS